MENERNDNTVCAQLHAKAWEPFLSRYDVIPTIEEDERFFYGHQWPKNNTRNEVRVTSNHIADLEYKRASKVAGTPIHFAYVATDDSVDCEKLARFDSYVRSRMGHDKFTFDSTLHGEAFGTAIAYVRFDANAPWMDGGLYEGGLEEELIPIKTFFCSNPNIKNIQLQEYVGFKKDIYVGEIRERLKAEKWTDSEYKERLQRLYKEAEGQDKSKTDEFQDKDLLNSKLLRVYIRYFRIDGEVCYEMATDSVQITKYPVPLSKAVAQSFAKAVQERFDKLAKKQEADLDSDERQFRLVEDLDIDFADTVMSIHDKMRTESSERRHSEVFGLYPFAVFRPKEKHNFVFGRSITKEMIPLQKGVNVALSMMLQHMINMAMPKVYARDGAMKPGETYTNRPEDNLQHDHYKGNGNGFYTIATPSVSSDLYKIPDYFVSEMKDSYDAKDFANGDLANMGESSGYAIQQMLRVANSALEQEQKALWQFETELARIRLLFYKHYFRKALFTYELTPMEYDKEESSRVKLLNQAVRNIKAEGNPEPITAPDGSVIPDEEIIKRYKDKTKKSRVEGFDANEIWGVGFDVQIDAQQGMVQSELSTSQWYQSMFGNGAIQAYSENPDLLTFIVQTAPKGVVPEEERAKALHYAEGMGKTLIARLRQENAVLKQQLGQSIAMGKAQQDQFRQNLGVASTMVKNAQAERNEAQKRLMDVASEGEIKSNNAKGQNSEQQRLGINGQAPIM